MYLNGVKIGGAIIPPNNKLLPLDLLKVLIECVVVVAVSLPQLAAVCHIVAIAVHRIVTMIWDCALHFHPLIKSKVSIKEFYRYSPVLKKGDSIKEPIKRIREGYGK